MPIAPPPLRDHGNYVISLNRFVKWLGEKVEEAGITVFTGFAGSELYLMNGSVQVELSACAPTTRASIKTVARRRTLSRDTISMRRSRFLRRARAAPAPSN